MAEIFTGAVRDGEETVLDDRDYLALFGREENKAMSAGELWRELAADCSPELAATGHTIQQTVESILTQGPLSRRIIRALGASPGRERFSEVYRELGKCLAQGRLFSSPPLVKGNT